MVKNGQICDKLFEIVARKNFKRKKSTQAPVGQVLAGFDSIDMCVAKLTQAADYSCQCLIWKIFMCCLGFWMFISKYQRSALGHFCCAFSESACFSHTFLQCCGAASKMVRRKMGRAARMASMATRCASTRITASILLLCGVGNSDWVSRTKMREFSTFSFHLRF